MSDDKKIITRRDFLRGTTSTLLAVAMGFSLKVKEGQSQELPAQKTRVVLVRDADAIKKGRVDPKAIQDMLDNAVTTLLDKKDPVEAWKSLVKPADIVGMKSNVWGPLPTPREIEDTLRRRIMDAGVSARNIGIDDRGVLRNRIFQNSTALINVRPLRTHHWSGIGGCIKNYIMFVPFPPLYHRDSCRDLGAIWRLPIVKDKTRVNILVMLTPLFHGIGAHHFDPTFIWPYKGMLLSRDPVAVDAVGLRIMELKRLAYFGKDIPLRPPAKHVVIADVKHRIGTSDLKNIEIVRLGWMEGALI